MHFTGQFLHFAYKEWNFLINMKYHQGSERIDIDLLVGERMVISMKIIVHDLGIHTEYFNKQDYKTIGDFIAALKQSNLEKMKSSSVFLQIIRFVLI